LFIDLIIENRFNTLGALSITINKKLFYD